VEETQKTITTQPEQRKNGCQNMDETLRRNKEKNLLRGEKKSSPEQTGGQFEKKNTTREG